MGLLDRLFKRQDDRYSETVTIETIGGTTTVLGLTPEELYSQQPALQAVVDFLARNVAQLPLKTYRMEGIDRIRERESVTPLLLARPSKGVTTYSLIDRTMHDLKLRGQALWYVAEDDESDSGWSITPIPASWAKTKTEDGFEPTYFKVTNPTTNLSVKLPAEDCVRFSYYNPLSPASTISPVDALKDVLAEQISAWQFRNQVWKNGGRVTSWISRPLGAPWEKEGRDRFVKQWSAYRASGMSAGRTPVLEDGMELHQAAFNAHEADFVSATQLSRQDVAAVYHVSPQMIWAGERQTYASAKDLARQLYADTLAPDLKMITDTINAVLLPMIGAEQGVYCEFDLQAKLNGAFEDQAAQLTSAVGTPYMTVAEARARLNLPYIEGTDVIARPLNTAYTDELDTPTEDQLSGEPSIKSACSCGCDHGLKEDEPALKARGEPTTDEVLAIAAVMRKFFKRQGKAVISKLDNPKMRGIKADGDWPDWWEAERWNRELAEDLYPVFLEQATADAKAIIAKWGAEPSDFSQELIEGYIMALARAKAKATNDVTYRQILAALEDELSEEAEGSTPRGVFEKAETDRADMQGRSFATTVCGWALMEAKRQVFPGRRATKTWVVTSTNPRASHAAMNGETVPFDDLFSNGANYPGDGVLSADESCNCQCVTDIRIYD